LYVTSKLRLLEGMKLKSTYWWLSASTRHAVIYLRYDSTRMMEQSIVIEASVVVSNESGTLICVLSQDNGAVACFLFCKPPLKVGLAHFRQS
jgi:hypothetical protein